MQPYIGTSISIGSLKSAALYFDYVIPINLGAAFTEYGSFASFPTELAALLRSLRELVPPAFRNNENFARQLGIVNKQTAEVVLSAAGNPALLDTPYEERARSARDAIYTLIDQFSLGSALLDCRDNLFHRGNDEHHSLALLIQLDLIDAERAPWEAIIEIRKDLEAQERLRRLRLFAYENYDGKSPAFVEDDILNRISEYEREAKRWGLEMTHSTLSTVLGSKILGGSAAASLVSVLTGAHILAVIGSLGVGTLELGRITFEVVRRRTALLDLERRNPVSYISYANRQIAKKSGGPPKHRRHMPKPW